MPQPFLFRIIDKAVFDYNMIEAGDKILVGASGGKDSTALIEYLSNRVRRKDEDFSFCALNIASEVSGDLPKNIRALFDAWNVHTDCIKIDVQGRLKTGRKMNCYWCSTQRRTELLHFALENGFNKIALGHHLDDALETLFMNALSKSEFATMPPVLAYKKYPVQMIRPLYYAPEKTIIEHAVHQGYSGWTCTCNFQDNSARKDIRRRISLLTGGNEAQKLKLFWSLKNRKAEYLP